MRPAGPSPDSIRSAASRIARRIWQTPMLESPWLSDELDAEVWLKLESVQRTGSFKIRGAMNAIAVMRQRNPQARCVTTASAGNHGLALATAAREFGLTARVHLPATAPAVKKAAIARQGATILEAPTYDEAEARVAEETARGDVAFISAYADTDVISGAGTIALEMLGAEPELDVFIVPLGGGGLLSGIATAVRERRPDALIVGAEAAASPVFRAALEAGRPVTVDVSSTIADGLAGNMDPTSQTFGIVRDRVDRVVTMAEETIVEAMRDLLVHERLYAEGAAATAIAAARRGGLSLSGRRVGIVVTGRNGQVPVGARDRD